MSDQAPTEGEARAGRASAVIVALAVTALGAFVLVEAVTGADNPGYATIGPGAFPGVVGFALILVGGALLLQAVRGPWRVVWSDVATPTDSPFLNVAIVAAALGLDVLLFAPLGFIIASAVLFTLVAAAFGSRRFVRDAALGLAFAGAIYLVFVHGLGLHLPAGSLWDGVPWTR